MATWIEDTGEIPDYAYRYDVEEETTDDKLTKITFNPYTVDPTGDEEAELNRYDKVDITDSTKIKQYQDNKTKYSGDAASEWLTSKGVRYIADNGLPQTDFSRNPEAEAEYNQLVADNYFKEQGAAKAAMELAPSLSNVGTYYRPGSGKPTALMDESNKIESQYRSMMQTCSKYKGAQYTACTKMVEARVAQMAKAKGFAKGGVVTAEEKTMMNYGYANGGNLDMDAIANQALDDAIGTQAAPPQPVDAPALLDQPMPMAEDEMMMEGNEDNLIERIISVLNEEEKQILDEALTMHPELITILDKADAAIGGMGEFDGEGPVSGPGTETSDSIPARLSDGEFVFTAKAVKQIGVDKLRKMMAKAEEDYDAGMDVQESEQMESMDEEGFAMGGLLDQARKEWGSLESATAEYNQPMEMQVPTNVDGAGRQVPAGETGIMAQRTVDLASKQQTAESQRRAANTGLMSANPKQSTTGSMANEAARAQTQSNLVKGTEEEDQMP